MDMENAGDLIKGIGTRNHRHILTLKIVMSSDDIQGIFSWVNVSELSLTRRLQMLHPAA
jgi:hypothetical protein